LAFQLLGHSIGAAVSFENGLRVLAVMAIVVFWLWIADGDVFAGTAVTVALLFVRALYAVPTAWQVIPPARYSSRDLVTYFCAALCIQTIRMALKSRGRWAAALAFSAAFFSMIGLLYSIDRGMFALALTAASIALAAAAAPSRRNIGLLAAGGILGTAIRIGVVRAVLGSGFALFLQFTFHDTPAFKEFIDGMPYPLWTTPGFTSLVLMAALIYFCALRASGSIRGASNWLPGVREAIERDHVAICMVMLSVFMFRKALGRADFSHIDEGIGPACLLLFFLLWRYIRYRSWYRPGLRLSQVALLILLGILGAAILQFRVIPRAFPLAVSDDQFLPDDMRATVHYLKPLLDKGATFVALDSNPSWYYFLDHRIPIRFPILWLAGTREYQDELMSELDRLPVTYVLYRNQSWTAWIDNIPNSQRAPRVLEHVREMYEPFVVIDGNEIWKRREEKAGGGY
jgi:hypothetical protein